MRRLTLRMNSLEMRNRFDASIHPSARGEKIYELFTSASLIIFSALSHSSSALVD